jgi:hypothetical protein
VEGSEGENNPFKGIPDNLRGVMKDIPLDVPGDPEQKEIYARVADGLCMTCEGPLGDNTMLIVSSRGIVFVSCGGACLTDMQVLGWLQEQHEDISQKVDFRGGGGDKA